MIVDKDPLVQYTVTDFNNICVSDNKLSNSYNELNRGIYQHMVDEFVKVRVMVRVKVTWQIFSTITQQKRRKSL